MSQRSPTPLPLICWSPGHVLAFDPVSGRTYEGANAAAIAGSLGGQQVVAAISRRNAFVRTARVPNTSRAEIAQVLALTIGNHVPVPTGELAYDFHLTEDVDAEGRLIVIGATRIETLRAMQADLAAAGLSSAHTLPVAFGAQRIAAHAAMPDCAVVEMTDEGLAIDLVAAGDVRYSRVVPPPQGPDEIDEIVRRSFEVAGLQPGPVIAAGGTDVPGASRVSETAREALAREAGLIEIQLEAPEAIAERARARERSRTRMAVVLIGACAVIASLIYLDFADAASKIRAEDAKAQAHLRTLRSEKTAAESKATQAEKLAGTLERAFDPAQPFSDVVAVLASQLPAKVWLNGISLERGKPLLVRGTALQNEAVTSYLDALRLAGGQNPQSLETLPRFRDVKLVVANNSTIETTPVVQFSVSALPVGNLPVVEQTQTRRR